MRIVIIGAGYVGLGIGILLSQEHNVTFIDTNLDKVNNINNGNVLINDSLISNYKNTKLCAYNYYNRNILQDADIIIIALPTDTTNFGTLNTSIIDKTIKKIFRVNNNALYVIKSTIPFGFTIKIKQKYNIKNVIFKYFSIFKFEKESEKCDHDCYNETKCLGGGSQKSHCPH